MIERYKVSAIAAIGKNRELGQNNKLLWDLPTDMNRFREKTRGHVVIMGRKTAESIMAARNGELLPKRPNVVVTSDKSFQPQGAIVVSSIEEALEKAKEIEEEGETFIIGGGQIYKAGLPFTDKLYLTLVHASFPQADTFFPEYENEFKKVINKEGPITENGYTYEFLDLER